MPVAPIGTDPQEAADRLRDGQLVALPTETVYGLGANALDERAVGRVFAAKQRPSFDPLIIHQATADRILAYASRLSTTARHLAEQFWPGPLTLVVDRVPAVPDIVTSGLSTVALRVPDHPLTRAVLQAVDFPVAAPSANPFGFVSPVTAAHVFAQLGEQVDYILDGGSCRVGLESTIVNVSGSGEAAILRKGGTPVEAIFGALGREIPITTHSSSRPTAPGMLSQHYSPGVEIVLLDRAADLPKPAADERLILLPEDEAEAARQLFSRLRELHPGEVRRAYVRLVEERGLGLAINDRLRRAAAK